MTKTLTNAFHFDLLSKMKTIDRSMVNIYAIAGIHSL